jgi:signal transduction histidine kinase
MLQIVNQLLDMAAIEAGRMVFDVRPSPVVQLVNNAVDMLTHKAASKNIVLSKQLPRLEIQARLDESAFQQIAINLIDNAIKFSPSDSVIQVSVLAESGHDVEITVADQGPGIAPDDMLKIFKPFWQSQDIYRRDRGGLGLGLAISHRLIHAMGGTIWVESTLGSGSTFHVSLPV